MGFALAGAKTMDQKKILHQLNAVYVFHSVGNDALDVDKDSIFQGSDHFVV